MIKVLSLTQGSLIKIATLLGFFLITGSCTKVDVRVTGLCCSPSKIISSITSCDLPEKSLDFTGFRQEATSWCWVANAQMVASHLNGTSRSQCEIVNDVFNPIDSCCEDPNSPECNRGWYTEIALEKEGITSSTPVKNPPKEKLWGMISSQICENNPLILAEYFSGGGGHSSAIYGFGGNVSGLQRWVWAYDPLDAPDPDPVTGAPRGGMQWDFDNAIYFASIVADLYGREEIYITESFE